MFDVSLRSSFGSFGFVSLSRNCLVSLFRFRSLVILFFSLVVGFRCLNVSSFCLVASFRYLIISFPCLVVSFRCLIIFLSRYFNFSVSSRSRPQSPEGLARDRCCSFIVFFRRWDGTWAWGRGQCVGGELVRGRVGKYIK